MKETNITWGSKSLFKGQKEAPKKIYCTKDSLFSYHFYEVRCETKSTVIVALNIQMCCCFEDRKHAAIFLEVSGAFISSMKKGNASVQIARDDEQTNWDAMHAVP